MGSSEPHSAPTAVTPRGKNTINLPAPGVPFYTPVQDPVAGSVHRVPPKAGPSGAQEDANGAAAAAEPPVPTLFTPLTVRGLTVPNRFVVSPMCMYSADDGHLTDFHLVHLGKFALYGAGLTFVEATAVTPNGRISPEDSGLWQDSQVAPLRRIADYVHSQGHKIGIQLAHAGRKASTVPLWLMETRGKHQLVDKEGGGWPDNVWAPSALPYDEGFPSPHAMTKDDIRTLVESFEAAARRAVAAGIDVIEIHGAHGYLTNEFLSPLTNKRTDEYGGSFENRTRLLREIASAIRGVIPDSMPLFLRVSSTDWMDKVVDEPTWTLADTIRLAKLLPQWGIDLIDVSSSGNDPRQKIEYNPYFQIDLAAEVKKALQAEGIDNVLVGAVGMITTAEMAQEITQKGGVAGKKVVEADLAFVARHFLREPEFVLRAAHQLGVPVKWAKQYERGAWHKGEKA